MWNLAGHRVSGGKWQTGQELEKKLTSVIAGHGMPEGAKDGSQPAKQAPVSMRRRGGSVAEQTNPLAILGNQSAPRWQVDGVMVCGRGFGGFRWIGAVSIEKDGGWSRSGKSLNTRVPEAAGRLRQRGASFETSRAREKLDKFPQGSSFVCSGEDEIKVAIILARVAVADGRLSCLVDWRPCLCLGCRRENAGCWLLAAAKGRSRLGQY